MLQGQDTTDRVRQALTNAGYNVEFLKATFIKFNPTTGNEVHRFYFINEDTDQLDVVNVYVWEHRGELYGDW